MTDGPGISPALNHLQYQVREISDDIQVLERLCVSYSIAETSLVKKTIKKAAPSPAKPGSGKKNTKKEMTLPVDVDIIEEKLNVGSIDPDNVKSPWP